MASFGKRDRAQYESDFGESWILDDVEKDDRLAQQLSLFTDSHQSQYGPAGYDPPVPREETSLVRELDHERLVGRLTHHRISSRIPMRRVCMHIATMPDSHWMI